MLSFVISGINILTEIWNLEEDIWCPVQSLQEVVMVIYWLTGIGWFQRNLRTSNLPHLRGWTSSLKLLKIFSKEAIPCYWRQWNKSPSGFCSTKSSRFCWCWTSSNRFEFCPPTGYRTLLYSTNDRFWSLFNAWWK